MNFQTLRLKNQRTFSISMVAVLLSVCLATSAIAGPGLQDKESESEYALLYQTVTAEMAQFSKLIIRAGEVTPEHRQRLEQLQRLREGYLNNLVKLAPENKVYRFELAKILSAQGDKTRAIDLLSELAPEDELGHPAAHLVLANHFVSKPAQGDEIPANLGVALKHVDHCLTENKANLVAKTLKAKILTRLGRYEDAYQLYDELLERNPNHYLEMIQISRQMKWQQREEVIYQRALSSFMKLADQEQVENDQRRWGAVETGIANTLQGLDRDKEAEERLESLIAKYAGDEKQATRQVFLQRLLAAVYISQANAVVGSNSFASLSFEELSKVLGLYTNAHKHFPESPMVLQALAGLTLSENPEIAEAAKGVYNPNTDTNTPVPVLMMLGNHAMGIERYSDAIRYYELARNKSPQTPAILNNLAYAYLVDQDVQDPQRALALINRAIEVLPKQLDAVEMSKFLHTKATALQQLERFKDAVDVCEQILDSRPNHRDTLQIVIECYQGLNKLPPEEYTKRLDATEPK